MRQKRKYSYTRHENGLPRIFSFYLHENIHCCTKVFEVTFQPDATKRMVWSMCPFPIFVNNDQNSANFACIPVWEVRFILLVIDKIYLLVSCFSHRQSDIAQMQHVSFKLGLFHCQIIRNFFRHKAVETFNIKLTLWYLRLDAFFMINRPPDTYKYVHDVLSYQQQVISAVWFTGYPSDFTLSAQTSGYPVKISLGKH